MGTIFTNIFGALVSLFIGVWFISIFIVTSPKDRMEKTCAPVTWVGSVATSLSMLFNVDDKTLAKTKDMFVQGTYGCTFTVWRLFYEDDWKAEMAAAAKKKEEEDAAKKKQEDAKPKPPKKSEKAKDEDPT
ncbi:hypothetical protein [Ottowia sp.]|uniref:hypothetical protein n=1 Tax=Ottowia sp. TaxID=1898956 RepID=UPI0025F0EC2C|nr:hypothetical protein [Ottowia sp.]MBK6616121.1 hypothetical protein [Ottowia sp.]